MLTELRLSNFRAFDEEVTLRLRPITILIGRNNAGKSSLVKFLLMLQQSVDPALPMFLDSDGSRVRLGAFRGLRHSRSKGRTLRFSMRFETEDIPSSEETTSMRELLRITSGDESHRTMHGVRLPAPDKTINDGRSRRGTVQRRLADCHVHVEASYSRSAQFGRQTVEVSVSDRAVFKGTTANLGRGGFLTLPVEGASSGALAGAFVAERFLQPLRYEVSSIRHLGPIRVDSHDSIVSATPPEDDVGQAGEYALPHLHRIIMERGSPAEFVLQHFKSIAGIDDLRFDGSSGKYVVYARARNRETSAWAMLSDFGFGVSQCLPVLIQGLLMPRRHLLMVEQPEAQLHPTAQLEMGQFFADLWRERQVASLIETHSANIILRIRRLIAKGKVDPADVSIAYLATENGTTVINNLDVNPDGSLERGLPMEFFGQDILEGLKLGARK
jgi:energy-coupling factor transporter ATP-binding protein EcfA2